MNSGAGRPYSSPLRREQQEGTRDRIVEAMTDLLTEGESTSMAAVAERAGVSERTVYRHFATRTELAEAVFQSVTQLFVGVHEPTSAAELGDMAHDVFPRYDRRPEVIRALQMSGIGTDGRRERAERRRQMVLDALAVETAGLAEAERRRVAAAVHVLASSTGYLHLRDFWGMDATDAADVVAWAVQALVRAAVTEGGVNDGGKQPAVGRARSRRVGR